MGFLNDVRGVFNTQAIPGIPNSRVGDIFGLNGYFGISGNPVDYAEGAYDKAKGVYDNLPYIIIGGGALALIFIFNK